MRFVPTARTAITLNAGSPMTRQCRARSMKWSPTTGMLACVSAGAGLALMPRSMLESMPGCATVSIWPLSEKFRYLHTWLIWRRGTVSRSLTRFVELLEQRSEPENV